MDSTKTPYLPFLMSTVFQLLILTCISHALDFESAKEQACLPIKKTAEVDYQWMMSVKEWYYPYMSRLDLYLTSVELTGNIKDPENLPESQVYYDSCVKAEFVENAAITTGFNGKSTPFTFGLPTVNDDGVTSQRFTSESGLGMSTYVTLTDNKSFVFMAVCWDNNQATWAAITTIPSLPEETAKLIHDHAESLGFKKEYFEEIRYDNCKNERKSTLSVQDSGTCEK